jgi:hypothetical protein
MNPAPIMQSAPVAASSREAASSVCISWRLGDKPVRASKRSAEWCIKAVEQCWSQKGKGILSSERATAKKACDEAESIYERILSEATRN